MSNAKAKFASAFFVGVIASLPLSTVFDSAARAADDCLSEPNGAKPQGKHWFYRIERGTGRHCWYLRGEDEKPAHAAATESASPESTPAPSRNADMLAPRSIADARAELPARTPVAQPGAPLAPRVVPPAGDTTGTVPPANAAPAVAGTPWPDPSLSAQPATTAAADEQADATAVPTPPPAPPPPAQAVTPMERNIGSLQKLLLVAFGALALAGLTGSAVYRLAGARHRARMRRDRWPARKAPPLELIADQSTAPWTPPELEEAAPPHDLSQSSVEFDDPDPVEFDDPEPEEHVERIEDFLARLTIQLEAELEAAPWPHHERQHSERQRAAG
jgi:hypothetical protein